MISITTRQPAFKLSGNLSKDVIVHFTKIALLSIIIYCHTMANWHVGINCGLNHSTIFSEYTEQQQFYPGLTFGFSILELNNNFFGLELQYYQGGCSEIRNYGSAGNTYIEEMRILNGYYKTRLDFLRINVSKYLPLVKAKKHLLKFGINNSFIVNDRRYAQYSDFGPYGCRIPKDGFGIYVPSATLGYLYILPIDDRYSLTINNNCSFGMLFNRQILSYPLSIDLIFGLDRILGKRIVQTELLECAREF